MFLSEEDDQLRSISYQSWPANINLICQRLWGNVAIEMVTCYRQKAFVMYWITGTST